MSGSSSDVTEILHFGSDKEALVNIKHYKRSLVLFGAVLFERTIFLASLEMDISLSHSLYIYSSTKSGVSLGLNNKPRKFIESTIVHPD